MSARRRYWPRPDTRHESFLRALWDNERSLYSPQFDERELDALMLDLEEQHGRRVERAPVAPYSMPEVESGDGPEAEPDLMDWEDIGIALGISRGRAWQIGQEALRKLRHVGRRWHLEEYR